MLPDKPYLAIFVLVYCYGTQALFLHLLHSDYVLLCVWGWVGGGVWGGCETDFVSRQLKSPAWFNSKLTQQPPAASTRQSTMTSTEQTQKNTNQFLILECFQRSQAAMRV